MCSIKMKFSRNRYRLSLLFRMALLKTLWVNLRCLPIKQAYHLPILIAKGVKIKDLHRGGVKIVDVKKISFGSALRVGFMISNREYFRRSFISIKGTLVCRGNGIRYLAQGFTLKIEKDACLEIGGDFLCGSNARIEIYKKLIIGTSNMWSFDIIVMDSDAHLIYNDKGEMISHNADVIFGDNVWLGCRNIVLKGARIPDNCILGAGGVITKPLDKSSAIYCGNKFLREGISWSREMNF